MASQVRVLPPPPSKDLCAQRLGPEVSVGLFEAISRVRSISASLSRRVLELAGHGANNGQASAGCGREAIRTELGPDTGSISEPADDYAACLEISAVRRRGGGHGPRRRWHQHRLIGHNHFAFLKN